MAIFETGINNISADDFKNAVNTYKETEDIREFTTFKWSGVEITAKHSLSFTESIAFCDDVISFVYTDGGEFRPERMTLGVGIMMLVYYTNINIPDDIEVLYDIFINTSIINEVRDVINIEQYNVLLNAIDTRISIINSANVSKIETELANVESMVEGFNKLIESENNDIAAGAVKSLIDISLNPGDKNES